jgi:hypothetical protein
MGVHELVGDVGRAQTVDEWYRDTSVSRMVHDERSESRALHLKKCEKI